MSIYQVQKALFDYLRAREHAPKDAPKPEIADIAAQGYDLTEEERKAVESLDLGTLYAMGTHPVIINGLARNMGYRKADYRPLLAGSMPPERKVKPRWLKS
jgi:hypothetical protein